MKWVQPKTYTNPVFPYKRSGDQDSTETPLHPVVIIGAGPTGLTAALDLANRGIPVVVLTKENSVVVGSRAICFAKKTLEIANRLGVADEMMEKGVVWNLGKVFYDQELIYTFNLLAEEGHKFPAFINLQQYYFEEYLVSAAHRHSSIDIRWGEEMIDIHIEEKWSLISIHTPEGNYQIKANYVLACDGAHSPTRQILGLPYEGEEFEENFLIADITMENDFPTERWFWFDPPFNRGYSALLHKQPDGVWRIDLQLGTHIDKEKELEEGRIVERLRKMLGEDISFELEWTSIYQFRCMRMPQFVYNRVIFAGDSAHLVSPFGARGANGGIQDVDNLCWKLAYVLKEKAPPSLLTTYDEERGPAADENIFHSSNSTDFISPKSKLSLKFRNAALELARDHTFARTLINSGRLSIPYRYMNSSLTTPDQDNSWDTDLQPGFAIKDATYKDGYIIDELGQDFSLILYANHQPQYSLPVKCLLIGANDKDVCEKYDLKPGSWYLIRPDHYIAGRGRVFKEDKIVEVMNVALGKSSLKEREKREDIFDKYRNDLKYQRLIQAHKDLSAEESENLNHKILLLMLEKLSEKELDGLLEEAGAGGR